jgi:hypothetical protein
MLLLFYSATLTLAQSLVCSLTLDCNVPSLICVSRLSLRDCSVTYFRMSFK